MTLVFGLSIGVTCGGGADVDPEECCSTSGNCQPESGMSDPQSCCDREATSKTAAPNPVNAGGTITYTLSYSNTGNENATGVVLSDAIPANTTFVSASAPGAPAGAAAQRALPRAGPGRWPDRVRAEGLRLP